MTTTDNDIMQAYVDLNAETDEAERRIARLTAKLDGESDPVRAGHLRDALAQERALAAHLVADKAEAGPEVRAARAAGKAPDPEPEGLLGVWRRMVRERAAMAGPRRRSLLEGRC